MCFCVSIMSYGIFAICAALVLIRRSQEKALEIAAEEHAKEEELLQEADAERLDSLEVCALPIYAGPMQNSKFALAARLGHTARKNINRRAPQPVSMYVYICARAAPSLVLA